MQLGVTLLIGALSVAIATVLGDRVLHRYHIWWMTESGAAILVGMVVGLCWYLSSASDDLVEEARSLEILEFQPAVFTLLLLPPIIFESGYSLNHSSFFSNFGAILTFAFAGTLVAFSVTAPALYYGLGGENGLLTPMESAAFAALISAVDPVATLAIFSSTGADPKLNALIFGESVLNDAVAIVLFKTVVQLGVQTKVGQDGLGAVSGLQFLRAVGSFCFIFIGSLGIGILGGAAIALFFKLVGLFRMPAGEAAPAEMIVLVCLSYSTFLLAEYAGLSGIVAALFGGAVAVVYVQRNLSPAGAKLCKTVVSSLAKFTETIVFLLIGYGFWLYTLGHTSTSIGVTHPEVRTAGSTTRESPPDSPCLPPEVGQVSPSFVALTIMLCILSRVVSTFPMAAFVNLFRRRDNRIRLNEQCVMWFSGLRGAIALALAVEFPTADEVGVESTGAFCYQRDHVVSCTIVVVLFTVFVMGGLTKPVLKLAGIEMGMQKVKVPLKPLHKNPWKNRLRWFDSHVVRPVLVRGCEPSLPTASAPSPDETSELSSAQTVA